MILVPSLKSVPFADAAPGSLLRIRDGDSLALALVATIGRDRVLVILPQSGQSPRWSWLEPWGREEALAFVGDFHLEVDPASVEFDGKNSCRPP